jgi:predicted MFS family arabinose efflux permease
MNMVQIGIILAANPLAALLLEIPTGAIADLYGRKFSVILGYILLGILFTSIFFFSNFYPLLLISFLIGASNTLTTGSYDAWVVDLVKEKGIKVNTYFSKKISLYNLAFVFSGLIGAFLVARFGLKIIWPASGAALFMSAFFVFFGKEKHIREKLEIKESFAKLSEQVKTSFSYSYRHPVLFYLIIISFILGISGTLEGLISWTPFLKSFGFPDYGFGYLWSVFGFLGVIAPLASQKFSEKGRERKFLISMAFLTLIYGFFVLFSQSLILLLVILLVGSFLLDFELPVWRTYFHKFIPSKTRATIGSLQSLVFSLAGIIALPLAGWMIDKIGARYTIFISCLLMLPVMFLYLMIKEK